MSFCDSYLALSIISIILILSIIIIILYKNNEDDKVYKNNKIETNLENFIETFIIFDKKESNTIQNNNKKINDLISQINTVNPVINYKTNDQINYNIQKAISDKINSNTTELIDKTSNVDIVLSNNITTLSNKLIDFAAIPPKNPEAPSLNATAIASDKSTGTTASINFFPDTSSSTDPILLMSMYCNGYNDGAVGGLTITSLIVLI